ncbi:MAG TPA: hypothetical protein VEX68_10780 [Bryobacteraceae bacterium]|nr:hypothetical protein [Bryobacteraceae bacterium]
MKDIQHRFERLLTDAEDCALISKLAADPVKRAAFQKLATKYRIMALELKALVISDAIQDNLEKQITPDGRDRAAAESEMSNRYFVTAVRKSQGLHTDEGEYVDEATAIVKLALLGEDQDCLIAEVTQRLNNASPQSELVVAQSERLDGEWARIEGELRTRTKGDEAENILRAGKGQ